MVDLHGKLNRARNGFPRALLPFRGLTITYCGDQNKKKPSKYRNIYKKIHSTHCFICERQL